ncbi:MAG: hypothetical protein ACXVP0_16485 [Bacteroidia bacterium]
MKALSNLFFLAGLLFFSCSQSEKGSQRVKVVDDIKYELTHIPKAALRDTAAGSPDVADLVYYKLIISEHGRRGRINRLFSPSNYNKLLFYINKSIAGDFSSSAGKAELAPVQVYFENNTKIEGKLVFMLAFEKFSEDAGNFTVQFNDNIFNNGPVRFNYTLNDINT